MEWQAWASSPDGTTRFGQRDRGSSVLGRSPIRIRSPSRRGTRRWSQWCGVQPRWPPIVSASEDRTVKCVGCRLWPGDASHLRETIGREWRDLQPRRSPHRHRLERGPDSLWDAGPDRSLSRFKGHGSRVYSVAFSPDGRRIASASLDETVKVWDAAIGKVCSP